MFHLGWKADFVNFIKFSSTPHYMIIDKDGILTAYNAPCRGTKGLDEILIKLAEKELQNPTAKF